VTLLITPNATCTAPVIEILIEQASWMLCYWGRAPHME